jgi:hypothetical protein
MIQNLTSLLLLIKKKKKKPRNDCKNQSEKHCPEDK